MLTRKSLKLFIAVILVVSLAWVGSAFLKSAADRRADVESLAGSSQRA
ncbi:MAG: hypothetical protein QMD04_11850 [Anaerolineales bacterium]|nr:hypothetical protein [Anaerolineales bacterium]